MKSVLMTTINHPAFHHHHSIYFQDGTLNPKCNHMKKVLLMFDGAHFSKGAFDFVRQLNNLEHVLVTGVFLPQSVASSLWSYTDAMTGTVLVPVLPQTDSDLLAATRTEFETLCKRSGMEYRVHEDAYDFALPELITETRFADLLVIGSESFFTDDENELNEYLQEVLQRVECPVIVVPEKFEFPNTTVLSYDGTASCVYAIKQFTYLFPELSRQPTLLVYAQEDDKLEFPHENNIEELAARHFQDLTLLKLEINPTKYFAAWMNQKEGAILVAGAYGRSAISQLFKKSFIKKVIGAHKIPVFIAHRS
jgi:nucleotide-binding universal stress UspA family protein